MEMTSRRTKEEENYQAHSMDTPRRRKMEYSSHEKGRLDGGEELPSSEFVVASGS